MGGARLHLREHEGMRRDYAPDLPRGLIEPWVILVMWWESARGQRPRSERLDKQSRPMT
jgi:hypothetical protein